MIVSQLDEQGFFVGFTTADESPLEPGVFLIPRNAVNMIPPESLLNGSKLRLVNGFWEQVPDPEPEPIEEVIIKPPHFTRTVVSMRQARLALLNAGLLDDVSSIIQAIEDTQLKRVFSIEWEYATTVDKESPLVAMLSTALSLTPEQLDSLFEVASVL